MSDSSRRYFRVVSGTMRVLVWANGYNEAIRNARAFRNWKKLGTLTKVQARRRHGKWWEPWSYIETKAKP